MRFCYIDLRTIKLIPLKNWFVVPSEWKVTMSLNSIPIDEQWAWILLPLMNNEPELCSHWKTWSWYHSNKRWEECFPHATFHVLHSCRVCLESTHFTWWNHPGIAFIQGLMRINTLVRLPNLRVLHFTHGVIGIHTLVSFPIIQVLRFYTA